MDLKTFSTEIDFAALGVETKTTIPILQNLLLTQEKGVMTVSGTDLEVAMVSAFPGDRNKINTSVPAKRLKTILGTLNGAEECALDGKEFGLKLSSGSFSANLPGMSAESYPNLAAMPESMETLSLPHLVRATGAVLHAISTEDSRFTLNGALLQLDVLTGAFRTIATDGHRLSIATYGELDKKSIRVLLPRRALSLLPTLGTVDTVQMGLDDAHVFFLARFKNGAFRLILTRKLTGNFPDSERVMPKAEAKVKAVVNREAMADACKRILPLADERSHGGRLEFGEGSVAVVASTPEGGDARQVVELLQQTGTIAIGFNLSYVADALRAMTSETVEFSLRDPASAMEIRGEAGEGVTLYELMMPLRL